MFYVGQKAFINKDNGVLVLNDPVRGLDFPGGKIQVGETDFKEALKREVMEETTLQIEVGAPFATWYLELPPHHRNAGKQVYLVGFRCKYISEEVKLSDEHNSFRWVNKDNYKEVGRGGEYSKALKKYFEGESA